MAATGWLKSVKVSFLLSGCKRSINSRNVIQSKCKENIILQNEPLIRSVSSLCSPSFGEGCVDLTQKSFPRVENQSADIYSIHKSMMHSLVLTSNGLSRNNSPNYLQVRGKSRSMQGRETGAWRKKNAQQKDEESDSDEDEDETDSSDSDSDEDDSEFGEHFPEDENLPKNYKEVKKTVKSMRMDSVVSAGLNMARNKVDEYFLASKLRVNGTNALKKSTAVSAGDYIDLVAEKYDEETGGTKVKRIRIVDVADEKTSKDNLIVYLRVWKGNVAIES